MLNEEAGAPVSLSLSAMDTESLRSKASQETLASLLQLDPSPIESPSSEKDLPPLPEQDEGPEHATKPRSATTSSVGLSGTGHGAIYYRMPPLNRPDSFKRLKRLTNLPQ